MENCKNTSMETNKLPKEKKQYERPTLQVFHFKVESTLQEDTSSGINTGGEGDNNDDW